MSSKVKRIVYAASTMGEKAFQKLFKSSPAIPGQQAQKYNRLLQQGIVENGVEVIAISTPPITSRNTSQKFIRIKTAEEKGVFYSYTPVINVSGVKNILFIVSSFLKGIRYLSKKDTVAVCDVLNVSASMGIVAAAKLLGKPIIGIVTDIPELMVTGHSERQVKYCHSIIEKCSGYVFLTEPMNQRLNPKSKPYIIIEGISDSHQSTKYKADKGEIRKYMYAGLLDAKYGVKNMVDGFLLASIPNAELHLCGSGPYVEELKDVVKRNSNVVFHGTVLNSEVIRMEKECSLLVNPRPSTGEFTKFSFPSKIMEYMSSGTATLATRLPGIPDEYYNFLISIEDESVEGVADAFVNVMSLSEMELHNIGMRAKTWVIENKNKRHQAINLLGLFEMCEDVP